MFHLATPLLVFSEVARLKIGEDWQSRVWTETGLPVRSAEGYLIGEVAGPDVVEDADLVIFPSWLSHLPEPSGGLLELARLSHARGARIAGLCLGAFPVARSGVLDGRSAVTHWESAKAVAEKQMNVTFDGSALYIDHGDVLTSAGTASALDACLHIVRTQLGSAAAATVARRVVVAPHREGDQAQYIARPVHDQEIEGPLGRTMEWALANLDQNLDVARLAARSNMSHRNFTRRFKDVTGLPPARWLLSRRLDEARQLLETTEWSVSRIAASCGFASPVTFRQNFVKAYATTPTSYRIRFTSR